MKLAVVAITIAVVVTATIIVLIVVCSKKKEGYNVENTRGATSYGLGGRYMTARGLDQGQHSSSPEFRKTAEMPQVYRRVPVNSANSYPYKDGISKSVQNPKSSSYE